MLHLVGQLLIKFGTVISDNLLQKSMFSRGTVAGMICPQHTAQLAVVTSLEFTCYIVKVSLPKCLQFSATPMQKPLRKFKRPMASPT